MEINLTANDIEDSYYARRTFNWTLCRHVVKVGGRACNALIPNGQSGCAVHRDNRQHRLLYADSQTAYWWQSDKLAECLMAFVKASGVDIRASIFAANPYGMASAMLGRERFTTTEREITLTVN